VPYYDLVMGTFVNAIEESFRIFLNALIQERIAEESSWTRHPPQLNFTTAVWDLFDYPYNVYHSTRETAIHMGSSR